MTRETFTTIGIIGKHGDPSVGGTLTALSHYLLDKGLEVLLDERSASALPDNALESGSLAEIGQRCDLAIVVGGDGTLLNAARVLADHDVPLAGINLGHLGFLTDISPDSMRQHMDEILSGRYVMEKRSLLKAGIHRGDKQISHSEAFNDVVVHKWNVGRMIRLETYINDVFVSRLRADGLIIATPTGSTAYALSAGGPILHPQLQALVLVPICPHSMNNRPIVIEDNNVIDIVVCDNAHDNTQITCDGQIAFSLKAGDRIRISKKDRPVRLIHPAQHNHYELLRAKLHWAENPLRS